jgi:hypothetical protein
MSKCLLRKFLPFARATLALLALVSMVAPVRAGSITYITPSGSTDTNGDPVDAKAVLTTSAGVLTITLTNLEVNQTDAGQLVSDLHFTVSGSDTLNGAALNSSSGQELTVAGNGSFTLGSTVSTGWGSSFSGSSGVLDGLSGTETPKHEIIGAPGTGGTYSNANGSIAGNKAHNPFLNQTATFTIDGSNISAATAITSVTFSFGTTTGDNITGQAVPEPTALVLSLVGIGFAGSFFYRSRRKAANV